MFPFGFHKNVSDIFLEIILKDFDCFVEPFCGKAEVSLTLMEYYKLKNEKKFFILNDIENYIYLFHRLLYSSPSYLKRIIKRLTKQEWMILKECPPYTMEEFFNLWINSKNFNLKFTKNGKYIEKFGEEFTWDVNKIDKINELYNYHQVIFFDKNYLNCSYGCFHQGKPLKTFIYFKPPKNIKINLDWLEKLNIPFILNINNHLLSSILECKKHLHSDYIQPEHTDFSLVSPVQNELELEQAFDEDHNKD
jgi:hypothetical protein